MEYQNVFQRYEIKYVVTKEQKKRLLMDMASYIQGDIYGKSTICNVYYDTPQHLLIRRSLEKPVYKEKLRVRSYGTARHDSTVFVELKKKYKSVVYKRRVSVRETDAMAYLRKRCPLPVQNQITEELDYFQLLYPELVPTVFLSYSREAFYAVDDENLRITFDENILWREKDLTLCSGVYGQPLMPENQVLIEVKTAGAMPLWLVDILSENKLYKTSFSKYGTVYQWMQQEKQLAGGKKYA